jgi:hypothetical protein
MIDLSRAKVNKRVPKNRFKAELETVDTITWLYKISADTADFRHGDEIDEMQVFAMTFKGGKADQRALSAIQKAIPYPILFIAHGRSYFTVEGELFESDKAFLCGDALTIDKRSSKLTGLYEDIAAVFIPIKRRDSESISELVERYKHIAVLDREIAALKRKVDTEKQPNKRMELNDELKQLKTEREQLNG